MKTNSSSVKSLLTTTLVLAGLFLFIALATSGAAKQRRASVSRISAPAVGDPACTFPGVTTVTDEDGTNDSIDANANHDIIDCSVAYPFTSASDPDKLYFTLKVASLAALTPKSFYFVSFTIDGAAPGAGTVHGVRMNVDVTGAVNFISYLASTGGTTVNPGPSDGRFVETFLPAEAGSSYDPTTGTITIIVKPSAIGLTSTSTHTLTNWDGGVGEDATATVPGVVSGGATAIYDGMPITLVQNGGTAVTFTRGGTPFTVLSNQTCSSATPTPTPTPTPGVARPRFFNYAAPLGMAENAGEPSIGVNWTTEQSFSNSLFTIPNGGTSMYFGGFMTAALKVTFSDCSSPATVTWEQKALVGPNAPRVFGDPILFTDHTLGRTFVAQLLGLTPAGSTVDVTDDDGDTFLPSEGSSVPSDIDHETIGGGPAHAPLDTFFNALPYKHPVYYSSQSIGEARAARSDDGGFTFGPAMLMYTAADCSGLHGHIKVAPDGTVYIPDNGCGGTDLLNHTDGQQAVIVSEDNGITWNIRTVPGSNTAGDDDASVGVSVTPDPATGKEVIYLGMQSADGHPRVAVSHDKGLIWSDPYDVGAVVVSGNPVVNCVFPEVVAGDYNRAAFAFFGTETEGAYDSPSFPGVWYLYLATTFDGGQTWSTENITPGDPIQRGGVCGSGLCRNLLDFFDITIDKEGRVLVGGEDGCIGNCVDGPPNSFSAKALISRQTGGRRLLAQYDPVEPVVPGAPRVEGYLNPSTTANLSWPTPDHGGSAITGYKVYRNTGSGFALFANVLETNYTDTTSGAGTSYRVTAVNGLGEGPYCQDFVPAAGPPPKACVLPGILTINDTLTDGQDNDFGLNQPPEPSVNVRQLFIAEPIAGKLVFTINVGISPAGTPPPQSQWYIIWNKLNPNSTYDRNWVGMLTSDTGAITYEYGNFGVALDPLAIPPNPNADKAVKVGDADSGSYNPATGEIRITVSNSKLENIQVGQSMTGMVVRTFLAKDPNTLKRVQTAADTTDPSHYDLVGNAACLEPVPLAGIVSRKTHGGVGPFDVNLPLISPIGIECRNGQPASGNHTIVFTFANPLTGVTSASTTSGTVSSSAIGTDAHEYIVNLSGVPNASRGTVTLTGISDTVGNSTASLPVTIGFLLGDTNADGSVNVADIGQTKSQSGHAVTSSNFREDVNVDGALNVADIGLVKSKSGTALP